MMDAVIRYRHYRWDELHAFLDNKAFYSRSSRFRGNCPGRPDMLWTEYQIRTGVSGRMGLIKMMLELNEASLIGHGAQKGRLSSGYEIRIRENMPAADVLAKVLAAMDKIVADLPLLLYATAHARQVRDYTEFMLAAGAKLSYGELAELVRGQRAKETLVNAGPFRIAQLPGGDWAAWIEGDELIPVFPDERQVLRYVTQRMVPYETVGAVFGSTLRSAARIAADVEMAGAYAPSPAP